VSASDPAALVEHLTGDPDYRGQLVHLERLPARRARTVGFPDDLPELLAGRLRGRGIEALWTHQAEALALARAGSNVVVATGTASGKSLCYQLPVFEALLGEGRRTALYLSPTKALAHDQLRAIRSFALTGVRAASYDGDTPVDERPMVRRNANLVLSNPDMLHQGILPSHERWSGFLRQLAFVVVDEAHTLRGVFGSHVAAVLRRLRRVCERYGARPVFVLASATLGNPGQLAERLVGLPVEAVTDDGSPRGPGSFALWEPPLVDEATGLRRSPNTEAAAWLTAAVEAGVRTLCFTRSRKAAELVATYARRRVAEVDRELSRRVRAYRAGYLAQERRALERGLVDGELLAVAATNALELGMDIGGLDAVVLNGFPGTVASMRQQAGRAGRQGTPSLAVLIGSDDPLDAYLLHHPADLFGRPVEAALVDPQNPYVLSPHLVCAAYEAPLTEEDLALFGPVASSLVDRLEVEGALLRRRGGLRPAGGRPPAPEVDLRNAGGSPVTIVAADSGQVVGTVDRARATSTVHRGAVYLHQGDSYLVVDLNLVHPGPPRHRHRGDRAHPPGRPAPLRALARPCRRGQPGGRLRAAARRDRRAARVRGPRPAPGPPGHGRLLVHALRRVAGRRPDRCGAGARRCPCGRARPDRLAAAVRHVRPLGHRRRVDRLASGHRVRDDLRVRRLPGWRRHRGARP
jgi:DEAD/DEAH box helicase domain-containing protein